MLREEEISNAVKEFREKRKTAIGRAKHGGWYFANIFEEGIKWADEHPKNVWHDANEKPHTKKWLLVQFDKDDYKILCLKDLYIDLWCDWCKIFNFIRWTYIEDLLPKGGEE